MKQLSLAGVADGFNKPLVVVAHQGIILLDYQADVGAGRGEVLDQRGKTGPSGFTLCPKMPAGVLNRCRDRCGYQSSHDDPAATRLLPLHVNASLAREYKATNHLPDRLGIENRRGGQDIPRPFGFVYVDPGGHLRSKWDMAGW